MSGWQRILDRIDEEISPPMVTLEALEALVELREEIDVRIDALQCDLTKQKERSNNVPK